jgi:hypothetical protein
MIDPAIVEMPEDPSLGAMPHYPWILDWAKAEVDGLDAGVLDFDDLHPDREWMWWSIRRQVSHMAWDSLVFTHRRCSSLLWPGGDEPAPVVWEHHHIGPAMKYDRVLDEDLFWAMEDLLDKLAVGVGWLERVVTEQSIETLRATTESIRGTEFWRYVIQVLPRGAGLDPDRPGYIAYDLEGSLWMVFYELLAHVRTIQRLKAVQGLDPVVELPRVGYLRLPEYSGETDANGPPMRRLRAEPGPR